MDKGNKGKRIIALIGVVLIGIMVIATLLTAFLDSTGRAFRSCLIVTIALPIALWVFMWSYGALTHKHTMASYDLNLDAVNPKAPQPGDGHPGQIVCDPGQSEGSSSVNDEKTDA